MRFIAGAWLLCIALIFGWSQVAAAGDVRKWRAEWPRTDFSKTSVDLGDIFSGGPKKDGIPAIDDPHFEPADAVVTLGEEEPVVSVAVGGETRAYPLQILIWHEIVNDRIGEVPIAVTYCPLCNSAVVFDRRLKGKTYDFGTTGKLRYSDLVMYDRQTESWWQQFTGEAIIGELTGETLKMLPRESSPLRNSANVSRRGKVLAPNSRRMRAYGYNPYTGYDSSPFPFMYEGDLPRNVAPLERVVSVGKEAWSLKLLRNRRKIVSGDLILTWEPGQNSVLDTERIRDGRDIGNVLVRRKTANGLEDVVHDIGFAFAYHAFHPDGVIHAE